MIRHPLAPALLASALLSAALVSPRLWAQQGAVTQGTENSFLQPCEDRALPQGALCGTYEVFEDRAAGTGRKIGLNIIVLKATGPNPVADPVFVIVGGPGGSATASAPGLARSWMLRDRDIVLVDQRGAGQSNPLHVSLPGSDSNLQGYLDPIWDPEVFLRAVERLEKVADLTKYTTPIAADDLDEVRRALGYDKINLVGGSYGSRAGLVYIRRHPDTVRSAIFTGIAPIAFKNPLYHAKAAQEGFDVLLAECRGDERYAIYHDLDAQLAAILERLKKEPAIASIRHPGTREQVEVEVTARTFAEAVRLMMYSMGTNRRVPYLIHQAYGGEFTFFAQVAIQRNRGMRTQLAMGMLMSVVGAADIPRIELDEIEQETKGTFLGDVRVRGQSAMAALWPRGEVPEGFGEPVRGDMPVLFISGTHDPVTPPIWGAEAARHFPNGKHIVVPAAHGTDDPAIERFKQQFLDQGDFEGLDTSFVETLKLPPLFLPERMSEQM